MQTQALPSALAWAGVVLQQLPERVAALGPWGPAYFSLVYAAALCCAMPATPLTLTAGYLFGLPLGFVLAVLAGGCAGAICFLLSRTLLRPLVLRLLERSATMRKTNRAVEQEGFRIIFLLRLSPILPFSLLSYACGLSNVRFFDFVFANTLGFMPATFLFTYLAAVAKQALASGSKSPLLGTVLGLLLTIWLVRKAAMVASKAVDDASTEKAPVSV